ncbi:hypothetical protein EZV62_024061 [Acer yangbiense]|uniref:Transmembrane protein n=1 Tax=Acer yangbiense TaxID=1000413 RepID=A0A5C7H3R0_9ROSI|nr:hypothetical protein EZV62_024061 [Acer yangbiense]
MASTSLLPNVQQQPVEANSQGVSSGGDSSSTGSIGPFFAVISVLTLFAIISCVLGRYCRHRGAVETPLDSIKGGSCLGWVKRRWRRCMAGEVEAGAKVMAFGEDKNHVMAQP